MVIFHGWSWLTILSAGLAGGGGTFHDHFPGVLGGGESGSHLADGPV